MLEGVLSVVAYQKAQPIIPPWFQSSLIHPNHATSLTKVKEKEWELFCTCKPSAQY